MKIDQNALYLKAMTNPATPPAKDGVNAQQSLSRVASPAQKLRSTASAEAVLPSTHGDFDAARVARIREDISAGRYQVDTAKIADGLLDSVRDLIGRN
ncbi:flagellar biosynthesis anti-sigma factor FlgM [Rhodoferax sp.]|uniref:flagellar biosynthesis anti-sigma factor FlgM n=1 Tax=Rhodoferax sp. TaxID=50421 RepID=UPI0008CE731E|nr:flagellar biosynthesis anti-sigma factor FlgM [Rhodoferax sp.]MDO8319956.1 flagellar biosynthesis anti-sigma factor FlgM [Rhodoferax sp.]MDP2680036.1 flagellar biosynthesis anti-sigma factor FlgM [Rhodoferax sp.]OGB51623.1 MAG: flagellar biosynthesis anti-sigma factor FlgM [Burkholderiales bacterium RIFOXYD12_FULL_59_19]OGB73971.1 MAG: flagellar biosynthesis anti-sigma factor FlgM [Burkholderiales bacterium RIFOXYC12_FULL_60_6]